MHEMDTMDTMNPCGVVQRAEIIKVNSGSNLI